MPSSHLKIVAQPKLSGATMLLALTGWMDGGHVSTGTVKVLMDNRPLVEIAHIEPDPNGIRIRNNHNSAPPRALGTLARTKASCDNGVASRHLRTGGHGWLRASSRPPLGSSGIMVDFFPGA